eukprot:TCALIF_02476-PA protein Name:"Similar to SLC5A7 High affinity choline transporter 1 (Homo sapiens)" AED:0.13 eAED:0.13 QI:0/0.8/0.72/0.90/0.7/0.81/11/202/566
MVMDLDTMDPSENAGKGPPLLEGEDEEGLNVVGLISIIVFYIAVLLVGIWAGWRQRKIVKNEGRTQDQEEVMLAGRNIGLFVGILTMGATWVGGGFINGSAEVAYSSGLVWVQAPFGFGLSLFISGTFFARKMRESRYVTMIDPFTQKYGKWGALQAFPSAICEIFWSAAILGALGSTLQVILKIDTVTSIIISAAIAVLYTLMGGLVSVAYTDVFQIIFIAFGLALSLPFAATSEFVSSKHLEEGADYRGALPSHLVGEWIDYAFLLLLGGIPWQCYFQRVLSSKTSTRAQMLSYGGGLIALVMAVPATLFGVVAKATDWERTAFGHAPSGDENKLVLPLCLQYLCPPWVTFFGLGAVSAAVMSSTDSSMLSASSMLARNVYKTIFRPKASEKEILIVLWCCIVINAFIATTMAIKYQSVYSLFVLCGDLVYVVVFPQLLLVLYFEASNTYGSVVSFFLSFVLRILCGDTLLDIKPVISFGTIYGENEGEEGPVPFRTIVMLISLVVHMGLSYGAHWLHIHGGIVQSSSRHLMGEESIGMDEYARENQKRPPTYNPAYDNKTFYE